MACDGCPFIKDSANRDRLRGYAEAGGWVPCLETVTVSESMPMFARIRAWFNEEECKGARMWRRNRSIPLPPASA